MATNPSTTALDEPTLEPAGRMRSRRSALVGAAAAIIAVGSFVAVNLSGDGGSEPALSLSLGDSNIMASCLPVDATILAGMSPAFAGTATAVDEGVVTLEVDHWYTGGDTPTVELHAMSGQAALIDGFDFEVGSRYLITAADGTVNFCGFSGPATAALETLFDEAFGPVS